jgi:hypothetical protein
MSYDDGRVNTRGMVPYQVVTPRAGPCIVPAAKGQSRLCTAFVGRHVIGFWTAVRLAAPAARHRRCAIIAAMAASCAVLSHLFVHVDHQEPIRAFYVDGLGLDLVDDGSGYLRLGTSADFHIGVEVVSGLQQPDEMELVIRVPDVRVPAADSTGCRVRRATS